MGPISKSPWQAFPGKCNVTLQLIRPICRSEGTTVMTTMAPLHSLEQH